MHGRCRAHVSPRRDRLRPQGRTSRPHDEVVAGRRAVAEAIRAGAAKEVLVAASSRTTPGLRAVLDAAASGQVPVHTASRSDLDALAAGHQGVVARIRDAAGIAGTHELSERDVAGFTFDDDAIVVVLDGVTDPQNLGAAARSAEAVGASMLVTRRRRAADVNEAAVRASAGALLHLPHARVANLPRVLERLQETGFWVVGLDGDADATIFEAPCPEGRVAVVVGSEGEGMARLTRERCDALVALPMRGSVGSLNVAAALAATLYGYVLPTRR